MSFGFGAVISPGDNRAASMTRCITSRCVIMLTVLSTLRRSCVVVFIMYTRKSMCHKADNVHLVVRVSQSWQCTLSRSYVTKLTMYTWSFVCHKADNVRTQGRSCVIKLLKTYNRLFLCLKLYNVLWAVVTS